MASFTVAIFSASSSGTSMPNASSNAITNSTWSSESAPRSSTKDAVGVTSASSTPSCSTIICFTRSSTLAIPIPPRSLVALSIDFCVVFPGLLACTSRAEYSRAKIVRLGPSEQPAHSIYPARQGQLWRYQASQPQESQDLLCSLAVDVELPNLNVWSNQVSLCL